MKLYENISQFLFQGYFSSVNYSQENDLWKNNKLDSDK